MNHESFLARCHMDLRPGRQRDYLEQRNSDIYGSGGSRDYLQQRNSDIYGLDKEGSRDYLEQRNSDIYG